jgi:hypothetical protein
MMCRDSIFSVLVSWPDDGSVLEPKLVTRETFTSSLLCAIDNGMYICDLVHYRGSSVSSA